ncbi:MAG: type I-E CRISPR-associated protein Cas6/Cse3/CasE [Neomegalonema sp.]|nr:type I-E CRISPR-associated protein Cas6/Cse3/CasE [Neomegalonema sp.]
MSAPLYFSRLRLKDRPDVGRLVAHIMGGDDRDGEGAPSPQEQKGGHKNGHKDGRIADAQHRLLWDVFSDGPDRKRDFLWHRDQRGVFYALSARPPAPDALLFDVDSKPFAPSLCAGDLLSFKLRCNATRTLGSRTPDKRGERVDVVMHALKPIPQSERALRRLESADAEGLKWLGGQGEAHGFRLVTGGREYDDEIRHFTHVDGYSVWKLPRRGRGATPATFGVLDFEGILEVTEPERFLAKLASGFGRGKAFGLGLMLIRRLAA